MNFWIVSKPKDESQYLLLCNISNIFDVQWFCCNAENHNFTHFLIFQVLKLTVLKRVVPSEEFLCHCLLIPWPKDVFWCLLLWNSSTLLDLQVILMQSLKPHFNCFSIFWLLKLAVLTRGVLLDEFLCWFLKSLSSGD